MSLLARQDRLTVRELARIQGLPDDFVFYGLLDAQYDDVCRAIPPIVTRNIAQVIRRAIGPSGAIKPALPPTLSTSSAASARGNKRRRTEDPYPAPEPDQQTEKERSRASIMPDNGYIRPTVEDANEE